MLLKNYCACHCGVTIRLKMLIYRYRLRFLISPAYNWSLVLTALITFFNNMLYSNYFFKLFQPFDMIIAGQKRIVIRHQRNIRGFGSLVIQF